VKIVSSALVEFCAETEVATREIKVEPAPTQSGVLGSLRALGYNAQLFGERFIIARRSGSIVHFHPEGVFVIAEKASEAEALDFVRGVMAGVELSP
jgi:hypothetical protein